MTESATLIQRLKGAWRDITSSKSGGVKADLSALSDLETLFTTQLKNYLTRHKKIQKISESSKPKTNKK